MATMERCPYCNRPLAGDICPAHGYVGSLIDKPINFPAETVEVKSWMIVIVDNAEKSSAVTDGWQVCDGTNGTPPIHTNDTTPLYLGPSARAVYYVTQP